MPEALPLAPAPDAGPLEGVRAALAEASCRPGRASSWSTGPFVPSLSDAAPAGVTIRSLADVLAEGRADLIEKLSAQKFGSGDAVLALNAALMQDGVVIEVAAGIDIAEPIHILYATATPRRPRVSTARWSWSGGGLRARGGSEPGAGRPHADRPSAA